jgi:hypothetical protein
VTGTRILGASLHGFVRQRFRFLDLRSPRNRFTDMTLRERVALLWVIEGNRYLRVHRGRPTTAQRSCGLAVNAKEYFFVSILIIPCELPSLFQQHILIGPAVRELNTPGRWST